MDYGSESSFSSRHQSVASSTGSTVAIFDIDRSEESQTPAPPALTERLFKRVYRRVWRDFYTWEHENAKQVIQDLGTGLGHRSYHSREQYNIPDVHNFRRPSLVPDDSDGDQILVKLAPESDKDDSANVVSVNTYSAPRMDPAREYESCTPSIQNLWPRRYEVEHTVLKFFPYANDSTFDDDKREDFAMDFEFLAWLDVQDPDLEVVQYETVKCLLAYPGVTFDLIDSFKIISPLIVTEQSGLLWEISQRDSLRWTSDDTPIEGYPSKCQKAREDELGRIKVTSKYFCPSLNCVHPLCRTHTPPFPPDESPSSSDVYLTETPTLTSDQLLSNRSPGHCGSDCFAIRAPIRDIVWDDHALQILNAILTITPDSMPCQLAIACRKPCYEVFAQRRKLILDTDVLDNRNLTDMQTHRRMPKHFADVSGPNGHDFIPNAPCQHIGPCSKNIGCECWSTAMHCQRNCRCSPNCVLRWRGCRCKTSSADQPCRTAKCACVKVGRECDPELCRTCCASRSRSESTCRNVAIQQGLRKKIMVLPATYGSGAFIAENAETHELIGEYIGEIQDSAAAHTAQLLNDHRKRKYGFTLVDDRILDALIISNETRFPNHAPRGDKKHSKTNFEAKVKYVNGQLRIGFYATKSIRKGRELLFDYGEIFFEDS